MARRRGLEDDRTGVACYGGSCERGALPAGAARIFTTLAPYRPKMSAQLCAHLVLVQ